MFRYKLLTLTCKKVHFQQPFYLETLISRTSLWPKKTHIKNKIVKNLYTENIESKYVFLLSNIAMFLNDSSDLCS